MPTCTPSRRVDGLTHPELRPPPGVARPVRPSCQHRPYLQRGSAAAGGGGTGSSRCRGSSTGWWPPRPQTGPGLRRRLLPPCDLRQQCVLAPCSTPGGGHDRGGTDCVRRSPHRGAADLGVRPAPPSGHTALHDAAPVAWVHPLAPSMGPRVPQPQPTGRGRCGEPGLWLWTGSWARQEDRPAPRRPAHLKRRHCFC